MNHYDLSLSLAFRDREQHDIRVYRDSRGEGGGRRLLLVGLLLERLHLPALLDGKLSRGHSELEQLVEHGREAVCVQEEDSRATRSEFAREWEDESKAVGRVRERVTYSLKKACSSFAYTSAVLRNDLSLTRAMSVGSIMSVFVVLSVYCLGPFHSFQTQLSSTRSRKYSLDCGAWVEEGVEVSKGDHLET